MRDAFRSFDKAAGRDYALLRQTNQGRQILKLHEPKLEFESDESATYLFIPATGGEVHVHLREPLRCFWCTFTRHINVHLIKFVYKFVKKPAEKNNLNTLF